MLDLLAARRRVGRPYELNPTERMRTTLLSSGGMTKRVDPNVAPSQHQAVAVVVDLVLKTASAAHEPECLTVALSTKVVAQVCVCSVDDVVVRLEDRPPRHVGDDVDEL